MPFALIIIANLCHSAVLSLCPSFKICGTWHIFIAHLLVVLNLYITEAITKEIKNILK